MKILIGWIAQFVGHHGGMDKVFANFANEMTRRGHQVTMVYCTEKRKILFFHNAYGESCKPCGFKKDHKYESYKKTFGFK